MRGVLYKSSSGKLHQNLIRKGEYELNLIKYMVLKFLKKVILVELNWTIIMDACLPTNFPQMY